MIPDLAGDYALFLDIDGTLVDIAPRPADVKVDPPLLALLSQLGGTAGGALALVSGRALRDMDALFAPLVLPSAGQHGAERRDAAGRVHRAQASGALRAAAERLARFAAERPGLVLENKGVNLAVHYRAVPRYEDEVAREMQSLLAALGEGFETQGGKMVLELKPAGITKGTAIAEFMREAPFRGRQPVFVGDDLTDESGFQIVNEMGGSSIKVGAGPSAAPWRLAEPKDVRAWLEQLA